MDYWQPPPVVREQLVLFSTTLDERIPEDHPVRLLDEILEAHDWTSWEAHYHGSQGQPPIHPKVLASVILYGMQRGIRSSRQLEYALHHSIDFIWLVSGRSIDHSTLCAFRTKFKKEVKELYRFVLRTAVDLGVLRLLDVAVDGTKVRANSNRHKTLTSQKIEVLLEQLMQELELRLKEAELEDASDNLLLDSEETLDKLPAGVASLLERQTKLQELLEQTRQADAVRRREGTDVKKNPAQIPITDSDSRILPNKEGGYAANYTPVITVDTESGFIVSTVVLNHNAEQQVLVNLLEQARENTGILPEAALADGLFASGENLVGMEDLQVELFSPLPGPDPARKNPAQREDPTQPVPEEQRGELPINPQSRRLDKAAFVFNEEENRYYCPEGRPLDFEERKRDKRRGQTIVRDVYRCRDCSGCPLIELCQRNDTKGGRTVGRDLHENRRQKHAEKMATAEAKARYSTRFHSAEAPIGILKHLMHLRQFLLRGLEKVNTEWTWATTAYNLKKLARVTLSLRADPTGCAASNGN